MVVVLIRYHKVLAREIKRLIIIALVEQPAHNINSPVNARKLQTVTFYKTRLGFSYLLIYFLIS